MQLTKSQIDGVNQLIEALWKVYCLADADDNFNQWFAERNIVSRSLDEILIELTGLELIVPSPM